MPNLPEPSLKIAAICERVLEEKDGALSLIRVVDRLIVGATGPNPPPEMPPVRLNIQGIMAWAGGLGLHHGQMVITAPDGAVVLESPTYPFDLGSLDRGHNIIINLQLEIRRPGTYWMEFRLNGMVKSRIPWRVLYMPSQTPSVSKPS